VGGNDEDDDGTVMDEIGSQGVRSRQAMFVHSYMTFSHVFRRAWSMFCDKRTGQVVWFRTATKIRHTYRRSPRSPCAPTPRVPNSPSGRGSRPEVRVNRFASVSLKPVSSHAHSFTRRRYYL
jgi:hypothetical protein